MVVQAEDDGGAAQEQEGFEERVVHQVQHRGGEAGAGVGVQVDEAASAESEEHVAELAQCREGEHALDVQCRERHRRRVERGEAADETDDEEDGLALAHAEGDVEREGARDEVDARLDHGRGVNERRHRGRALHGVGQPQVERELRRLADGAAEDQQAGPEQGVLVRQQVGVVEQLAVAEGPERGGEQDDAQEQENVAEARHHERLLGGRGGAGLRVPVPDEEVGAEAHDLPEDEHQEVVVHHDGAEHAGHEERLDAEVAAQVLVRLVGEVRRREDDDEQGEQAHQRHQPDRQVVEQKADGEVQVADGEPLDAPSERLSARQHADEEDEAEQERAEDGRDGEGGPASPHFLADEEGCDGKTHKDFMKPAILEGAINYTRDNPGCSWNDAVKAAKAAK